MICYIDHEPGQHGNPETDTCYHHVCSDTDCKFSHIDCEDVSCSLYQECYFCLNYDCPKYAARFLNTPIPPDGELPF